MHVYIYLLSGIHKGWNILFFSGKDPIASHNSKEENDDISETRIRIVNDVIHPEV